jgi:hypothetical protein
MVIGGRIRLSDDRRPLPTTGGYQLALRTPGIIPDSASSLKQMRQRPKRRRYARDRPQRAQRFFLRTANFGFRLCFSINDFGGTN